MNIIEQSPMSLYTDLLKHDYQYINENNAVSVEGFVDTLTTVIPTITNNFKKFANSLKVEKTYSYDLNKKLIKLIEKFSLSHQYIDIKDEPAHVPPYYTGSYIEFASIIENMAIYSKNLMNNIEQFDKEVALIVSTKQAHKNDLTTQIGIYNKWKSDRETLKHDLAALFTSKTTNNIVPYSQVIKRQKDWDDVLKSIATIDKIFKELNIKDIKSRVDKLSSNLDGLKDKIDNGELTDSNRELCRAISLGTLEIAEQCELHALVRYQFDILSKCIEDTIYEINASQGY